MSLTNSCWFSEFSLEIEELGFKHFHYDFNFLLTTEVLDEKARLCNMSWKTVNYL